MAPRGAYWLCKHENINLGPYSHRECWMWWLCYHPSAGQRKQESLGTPWPASLARRFIERPCEMMGECDICFRIRKINGFQLQRNTKDHLPCEALQPSRTALGFQCTPQLTFCPSFSQRGDEALRVKVTCPSRMRLT